VTSPWGLTRTGGGVSVDGEIDLSNVSDLRKLLRDSLNGSREPFLIDLSEVTFMDSAGVTILITLADDAPGTEFVIRPSRQIFTLLDLVGLTKGAWPNVKVLRRPDEDGASI
jgi:anti-sigma B factor antagonist